MVRPYNPSLNFTINIKRETKLRGIGPEIILQKQFRPPINKVCIEVPAGLVDEDETAEEAAVRELKEETGYVGVVSESTPVMFNGIPSTLLPSTLFSPLSFPIASKKQKVQVVEQIRDFAPRT